MPLLTQRRRVVGEKNGCQRGYPYQMMESGVVPLVFFRCKPSKEGLP